MTNTVTPCQKDKHLSPKTVKIVADEDKNKSLKETKTESEVASNANLKHFVNEIRNESLEKGKTAFSEEACDENTEIMNCIPCLECIDENDAGMNYEGDEGDEIDNNDNNDIKSSLHDYHLSQYITSQTSNTPLTQLSETSLSNVRTNLDIDSISIMSQKRKRTLNDNFLTKKHLKKTLFLKLIQKQCLFHMVLFVDHIKLQTLICSNCRLKYYLPLLLTVVCQNLILKDCLKVLKSKMHLH